MALICTNSGKPVNDFGQQRLNSTTDWSAAKGGKVLPHFEHIIYGELTPLCPIMTVFKFLPDELLVHNKGCPQ
jgi:hypothetical protein